MARGAVDAVHGPARFPKNNPSLKIRGRSRAAGPMLRCDDFDAQEKTVKSWLLALLAHSGFDYYRLRNSARGLRHYLRNRREFLRQHAAAEQRFSLGRPVPILADRYLGGGTATGHYFHQDLHVARRIYQRNPDRHVDVASRVDGFVAHVATFRPIEVFDIRPIDAQVTNITFKQRDIMAPDHAYDDYTDSLSCLHVVEHFGLGRYGDPVDYLGHMTGWANLARMVKPGGMFYFSVPIAETNRVDFDAHRALSVPYILDEMIGEMFEVTSFSYVDDQGAFHPDVDPRSQAASSTFGLTYGCGVFELRKPRAT